MSTPTSNQSIGTAIDIMNKQSVGRRESYTFEQVQELAEVLAKAALAQARNNSPIPRISPVRFSA